MNLSYKLLELFSYPMQNYFRALQSLPFIMYRPHHTLQASYRIYFKQRR